VSPMTRGGGGVFNVTMVRRGSINLKSRDSAAPPAPAKQPFGQGDPFPPPPWSRGRGLSCLFAWPQVSEPKHRRVTLELQRVRGGGSRSSATARSPDA
jgi:hypothetical protein